MPDPAVLTGGPQKLAMTPMAKQTDPTQQTQNGASYDTLRQLYQPPSYGGGQTGGGMVEAKTYTPLNAADALPSAYPKGMTHFPVQYGGPSEEKENMDRLNTLIAQAPQGQGGAMRYAPIGDKEVNYLKYMEDMADLAKFDNYVESFIDPRQPGSAEFLFKVYPEYINRRMQQAHTDYEFALRNQMIDMWGINTFDDLYFKYLVDQGRINGPSLKRDTAPIDDSYTTGYLSPWSHPRKANEANKLYLPFASAKIGAKPRTRDGWAVDRTDLPFRHDQSRAKLADAVFQKVENDSPAAGTP